MGRKLESGRPLTLGDLLMNATVNGQEVEVTAGALLHGAMADTFNASVTATEGELGWDTESERIEQIERKAQAAKQRQIASDNRYARHMEGSGAYKGNWKPSKGTRVTVVTTPANKVTKTGEIVKNDVSEGTKPRKMTKLEFDGKMDLHRKLYERDSSGKWVHNCAAARTYRHQVWEYNSKQRDEAGELIRTEHPDVRAVQLAA